MDIMTEAPTAAPPAGARPNFFGQYLRAVDVKGRLSVPFRFRPDHNAPERYVLLVVEENKLVLYPESEWGRKFEEVRAKAGGAQWRGYIRQISSSLSPLDLDSQGRVMIPKEFLSRLGIEKKVLVVGMCRYMEIYRPETFAEVCAKAEPLSAEFTDLILS
jgi:MraZ protein